MLLFIGSLIVVLGLISLGIWGTKKGREGVEVPGYVFGTILGLAFLLTSSIIPLNKQAELQRMVAFYETNSRNYEATATQTHLIMSEQQIIKQALIPIEGSIEKIDVGGATADRLLEWRNEVVEYNEKLAEYRFFAKNIFVGYYVPNPPEHLKYIVIE